MEITELTDDNAEEFEDLLDDTLLSDIGREYHGGLVAFDNAAKSISSALFWEIKNAEDSKETTVSEIVEFFSDDPTECDELLRVFDEKSIEAGAGESLFEFDKLDDICNRSLKKNGFKIKESESRDICVSVGDVARLALIKKKTPDYIKSLSQITERQFKTGVMTSVMHGRYGLLDDLPFLPMSWFDTEVSSCVVTDDKINGLLLIHKAKPGVYMVELLFALQPDAVINLLAMIIFSINAAIKCKSSDDMIILRRHSESSEGLVKKLFPGKKGAVIIRGEKIYE